MLLILLLLFPFSFLFLSFPLTCNLAFLSPCLCASLFSFLPFFLCPSLSLFFSLSLSHLLSVFLSLSVSVSPAMLLHLSQHQVDFHSTRRFSEAAHCRTIFYIIHLKMDDFHIKIGELLNDVNLQQHFSTFFTEQNYFLVVILIDSTVISVARNL